MRNEFDSIRLAAGPGGSPGHEIGEQARRLHGDAERTRRRSRLRRGFSFVELLFAIMILGIGFIMIAAIFPVAIRQTAASGEETVAATIAKGAVSVIQQFANNALMPATGGRIVPIGPTAPTGEAAATALWTAISGNMILPSDNRYAWAAMYERDGTSTTTTTPYAQVIVIGMQVRNRTQYTPADTTFISNPNNNYPNQPNLQPKQVIIDHFTNNGGTTPDTVTFFVNSSNPVEAYNAIGSATSPASTTGAVADGDYLVINDDPGNATQPTSGPLNANGYIYRIGNLSSTAPNTWELASGNDLQAYAAGSAGRPTTTGGKIHALVVGRSIHDPTQTYDPTANPYEGLSQDISIYVSFVRINS